MYPFRLFPHPHLFWLFPHVHMFGALIGLLVTIFWIVMLVDVIRRQFSSVGVKVVWLLVILISHVFGAVIYCIFGRPMGNVSSI